MTSIAGSVSSFFGVPWQRMPGDRSPTPQPGLDDLMTLTGTGDRAAFAKLYDLAAPLVFGLALRIVRDRSMAEEVFQDIMLEIWRTAPSFDRSRGSAKAYIATVAHRRSVDRVRAEQSHRTRLEKIGARSVETPFDQVAEEVERGHERRGVREAMGVLTDLQRDAVELAYFEGLTQREIANRLGVPLGTVKTRMRDGMIRLAGELGHLR